MESTNKAPETSAICADSANTVPLPAAITFSATSSSTAPSEAVRIYYMNAWERHFMYDNCVCTNCWTCRYHIFYYSKTKLD